MVILTHAGGFRSRDPQHTLSEKAYPRLSYTIQTNARLFIKHNQAYRHKYKIGCPGWAPINYPVDESFNISTEYFSVLPDF